MGHRHGKGEDQVDAKALAKQDDALEKPKFENTEATSKGKGNTIVGKENPAQPGTEGGDSTAQEGGSEDPPPRNKNRHGKGRKLQKALAKASGIAMTAKVKPADEGERESYNRGQGEDQIDAKEDFAPPKKLKAITTTGKVQGNHSMEFEVDVRLEPETIQKHVIVIDVESQMADLKRLAALKITDHLAATTTTFYQSKVQAPAPVENHTLEKSANLQENGEDSGNSGENEGDNGKSSSRKKRRHGKGRKLRKALAKTSNASEYPEGGQNNYVSADSVGGSENGDVHMEAADEIKQLKDQHTQTQDEVDLSELATPTQKKKKRQRKKKIQSQLPDLPEDEDTALALAYSRSPSEESQIITSAPPTPMDSKKLTARLEGTFDKFIKGVRASSSSCNFDVIHNQLSFTEQMDDATTEEPWTPPDEEVDIKSALKEDIEILQNNCQSYFNWLQVPFSKEDSKTFVEILQAKIMDTGKDEQNEALRFEGFEKLSNRALLAFMLIRTDNEKKKLAIDEAFKLMQTCREKQVINFEYLEGFNYVVNCLKIYVESNELDAKFQNGLISEEEHLDEKLRLWRDNRDFVEDLTDKEKAICLAMKYFFEKELYAKPENQVQLCRDIISLDSENPEWHLFLIHNLRLLRRDTFNHWPRPVPNFKPEIDAAGEAMKLGPQHPGCLLANCLLIADMAFEASRTKKFPIVCGPNTFDSLDEVVAFIKALASVVLNAAPKNMNYNLTVADIFYKLLPDTHKDKDYAKKCMKQALAINPKSSKANHRMAMFFLVAEKSLVSAEKYCTTAFNEDKRNFPAYCELAQILLANPVKNARKLGELFDFAVTNQSSSYDYDSLWSPRKIAMVEYMRCLFMLMTGKDFIPAVIKMIELEKSQDGVCTFRKLGNQIQRYNWATDRISYNKLCRALKGALDRTNVEEAPIVPEFQLNQDLLRKLLHRAQEAQKQDARNKSKQQKHVEEEKARNMTEEVEASPTARVGLEACTDIRHRKS